MLGRIGSALALASVTTLIVVGCTPEEPVESTPPPSESPLSSSVDGELTETLRAAWDRYQSLLSELGEDPASATVEDLLEVATPGHASFLAENFEDAAERRIHTEGVRSTSLFALEPQAQHEPALVSLCEDLSAERLIGDEGEDLTPPEQQEPRSRSVTFVESEGDFVVANVVAYDGPPEGDPCR